MPREISMTPPKRTTPLGALPELNLLRSPSSFLKHHLAPLTPVADLELYETWFQSHGQAISDAVDRARTPWLRMFDLSGRRVDEMRFPSEYWAMLHHGYRAGVIWRAFEQQSLLPSYQLIYLTSVLRSRPLLSLYRVPHCRSTSTPAES
jgi:hypothetical protein